MLAAAACGFANAQTTAYTTPVGYVTIAVPAESDTTVSAPLEQPSLYSAASTSISGNVVGASGLTGDAFVNADPANAKCYLQVTSGALAGSRFPITANSSSSITVDAGATTLAAQGFVSGASYKVVPYWTLASLFPAGSGVGATNDVYSAAAFVMVSDQVSVTTNKANAKLYFYCSGDTANEFAAGWYDNDDVFSGTKNDVVIDPSHMYTIRTAPGNVQSVVVSGQVPSIAPKVGLPVYTSENDLSVASQFPVDVSLQESGLQSVLQPTTDVYSPAELVFVFDDEGLGQNKAASKVYFYCSGDSVNEFPAGWYDNDDVFSGVVTDKVIKAGRSFIIRKGAYQADGALPWNPALPYTL